MAHDRVISCLHVNARPKIDTAADSYEGALRIFIEYLFYPIFLKVIRP